MWRSRSSFDESNTEVLLVSFETPSRIAWYLEDVEFGWPVLFDEERVVYAAYGLRRAGLFQVWLSPRTVGFYVRALLRRQRIRRPKADSLQLGGDVLIDSGGIVRFIHRSSEPADRPAVGQLQEIAKSLHTPA